MNRLEPFGPNHEARADGEAAGDRAAAILWIRVQMARHGVSYDDLVQAGCFDAGASREVRYRSADGRSWDGRGEMPDWLQRAVNAGQCIEHFRIG